MCGEVRSERDCELTVAITSERQTRAERIDLNDRKDREQGKIKPCLIMSFTKEAKQAKRAQSLVGWDDATVPWHSSYCGERRASLSENVRLMAPLVTTRFSWNSPDILDFAVHDEFRTNALFRGSDVRMATPQGKPSEALQPVLRVPIYVRGEQQGLKTAVDRHVAESFHRPSPGLAAFISRGSVAMPSEGCLPCTAEQSPW